MNKPYPLGGAGGIMSDVMTSQLPGDRRIKVSAVLADDYGHRGQISGSGELITAGYFDDISVNFQYGIRTRDVRDGGTVSGTGSVGTVKASAYVDSGTGVGAATLTSLASVRYRAGHECFARPSVVFGPPTAGVNQYAGLFNGADALAVGYQGVTFGLWYIEGGNVNFIPQSTWNVDVLDGNGPSRWTLNPQGANIPVITYTWHGFKDIALGFDRGDGVVYVAHIIENIGIATETHLENPSLPIAVKVERVTGTGPAVRVLTSSWRAGITAIRPDNTTSDSWFNITVLDADGLANTRNNIVTVRNKAVYGGKNNHIRAELGVVSFVNNLNKTVAVFGTKGATLAGNGPFVDVDLVNSVLSYSTGGTVSGGGQGPATVIAPGQDRRTEVLGTGIDIYPGEELTIEVVPGTNVTGQFSVSLRFKEYH